jgi:hypothetical protein
VEIKQRDFLLSNYSPCHSSSRWQLAPAFSSFLHSKPMLAKSFWQIRVPVSRIPHTELYTPMGPGSIRPGSLLRSQTPLTCWSPLPCFYRKVPFSCILILLLLSLKRHLFSLLLSALRKIASSWSDESLGSFQCFFLSFKTSSIKVNKFLCLKHWMCLIE